MSEQDPAVEYRDIPGIPGYQAGADGTIWSCWVRSPRVMMDPTRWKRMRTSPVHMGHHQVNIKGKVYRAHTLILLAFVGPRPEGKECRHFPDQNPANNRIENLSWATHVENMADKLANGTDHKGEKHGGARFTEDIVRAMRADHAADSSEGWTSRLARKYNTDARSVHRIIKRERWGHVV